ncbi:hypothetical protein C0995_004150 [Termitomyces sp. Mi166|nr:hypothetical protein C0995_004150 [Termitomyces sp. Mi166\
MAKWVEKKQAEDLESSDKDLVDAIKEEDIDQQIHSIHQRATYTEEAQLMELLANDEADEDRIPDDGELKGLSDNFKE